MSNWNDGALIYGARKLDIYPMDAGSGGSGTGSTWATGPKRATYLSEQITVNRPQAVANQKTEAGVPAGGFGVDDFVTGSTVIQIADIAKEAHAGDAFTVKLDGTNSESFVITDAGHAEEQLSPRKQSISFRKLYIATGPTLTA
jgi:hypothetical protein